jgi:hypothetical protein
MYMQMDPLPPIKVDESLRIQDGFLRWKAAKRRGDRTMKCFMSERHWLIYEKRRQFDDQFNQHKEA